MNSSTDTNNTPLDAAHGDNEPETIIMTTTTQVTTKKGDRTPVTAKRTAVTSPGSLMALRALNATMDNRELPPGTVGLDIAVDVAISLEEENDKTNAKILQTAQEIQQLATCRLREVYTGQLKSSVEDHTIGAPLVLKVYIVLATPPAWKWLRGRAGCVCLEWFLRAADGSYIYKSGRVGLSNHRRPDQDLPNITPLPSTSPWKRQGNLVDRWTEFLVNQIIETIHVGKEEVTESSQTN